MRTEVRKKFGNAEKTRTESKATQEVCVTRIEVDDIVREEPEEPRKHEEEVAEK